MAIRTSKEQFISGDPRQILTPDLLAACDTISHNSVILPPRRQRAAAALAALLGRQSEDGSRWNDVRDAWVGADEAELQCNWVGSVQDVLPNGVFINVIDDPSGEHNTMFCSFAQLGLAAIREDPGQHPLSRPVYGVGNWFNNVTLRLPGISETE